MLEAGSVIRDDLVDVRRDRVTTALCASHDLEHRRRDGEVCIPSQGRCGATGRWHARDREVLEEHVTAAMVVSYRYATAGSQEARDVVEGNVDVRMQDEDAVAGL
jgi:hypothetical protein